MVLPAYISMAEILARVSRDHWRACHSDAPRPGGACAAFYGSQRRAAPVETSGSDGSLRVRGVLAGGSRSPQPVFGSARPRSGPATCETKGGRSRVREQAL